MKLIIRIGRVMIMIGLIDTIVTKLGIDSTLFIIGFSWMIIIAEILTNKDFNTCIWMVLSATG